MSFVQLENVLKGAKMNISPISLFNHNGSFTANKKRIVMTRLDNDYLYPRSEDIEEVTKRPQQRKPKQKQTNNTETEMHWSNFGGDAFPVIVEKK